MGKMTLILGGARSGKSSFAERLARQHGGRVAFIATAQPLDVEMQNRVEAHQRNRPNEWQTYEIPSGVGFQIGTLSPEADVIILDCVTLLVSNLLLKSAPDPQNLDPIAAAEAVEHELERLLEVVKTGPHDWLIVSNEVGMGLVPPYPLGRLFRDVLGWANQRLAGQCDQVYFLLAGIPLRLVPLE
jgi:adenosylcobinamide kinase/adenosylcobinamide-phosphate guanylyltransferase